MDVWFQKFAAGVSRILGSVRTFIGVLAVILLSGVIFRFSEEWQNIVGFTTSVATFLILFFLQKSQNVGDKATHAKLDELIRAATGARNEFTAVEEKHEHEIDQMRQALVEECETDGKPENDSICELTPENLEQAQKAAGS